MKKYKYISIILTCLLICFLVIKVCNEVIVPKINNNKRRNELIQNVSLKLDEEELHNVNIKKLAEDILNPIKHAKLVEGKTMFSKYNGEGYTVSRVIGGDCIIYTYYCGDKEIYSQTVGVPLEEMVTGYNGKIYEIIIFSIIALGDVVCIIKYRKSKFV